VKPAPFRYLAPASRDEAFDALKRYGPEAKILAGGQSLVPLLAMRLARPAVIIDLNRISDLGYVRAARGAFAVGAMTRQHAVEHDARIAARLPLLRAAVRWVGHPQIRTRGTVGGSLAHADPAAELPAVAAVLGARFVVARKAGERILHAAEFFTGYLSTALEPDEMLTEVRFPILPPDAGWAFTEVARRHGDFALVGVAAVLRADDARRCEEARLALIGVGQGAVRAGDAEQFLLGRRVDDAAANEAGRLAAASLDPDGDIHASGRYRRHVAGVLTTRAILEAAQHMQVAS
jgi:carbon-monoxide dehydrogenase medium subunit